MIVNKYTYTSDTFETPCILLYSKKNNIYMVSWVTKTENISDVLGNRVFITLVMLQGKPSIKTILNLILEDINSSIDSKILEGYTWNGYLIWLSLENLFNYKAAYDITTQSNGLLGLPVTFKFTDPTTLNPVYHTFTSLEELLEFYLGAVNHINNTLAEGWRLKDTFDFSPYEEWLKEHANNN